MVGSMPHQPGIYMYIVFSLFSDRGARDAVPQAFPQAYRQLCHEYQGGEALQQGSALRSPSLPVERLTIFLPSLPAARAPRSSPLVLPRPSFTPRYLQLFWCVREQALPRRSPWRICEFAVSVVTRSKVCRMFTLADGASAVPG